MDVSSSGYNTMNIEKDCGALGGLFQQIINDMKASSPIWEDFLNKATKLHAALRTTVVATTAFLDAFQKVADLATNTKGATKEIGSSLTRLCIRHRSIEKKLKDFTNAILEVMVLPLQDKKEDWKSRVMHLDKEHAKEYKKARAEIKRATSDTMKLQKKLKKGKADLQIQLSAALQDVTDKFLLLEETEKNSVRQALIEQRSQFCQFLYAMKPVVDGEITMVTEVTHLQEIIDALSQQSADPQTLPPASEQVIQDLKGGDSNTYTYQTPPSSPSSIGSRKSSMCSINSLNSNSSGSTHNNSPSHHIRHRPASQHNGTLKIEKPKGKTPIPPGAAVRLSSISSQDSGFTSQDALFLRPPSPSLLDFRRKSSAPGDAASSGSSSGTGTDSGGTTPSPSYPLPPSASLSTWANWPDPPYAIRQDSTSQERPHTISTAYERSHARPPLSKDMFEPPEGGTKVHHATAPPTPNPYAIPCVTAPPDGKGRPPTLPPPPLLGPKPRAKPVAAPTIPEGSAIRRVESLRKSGPPHVYVNTRELATIPGGNEDATDEKPTEPKDQDKNNLAELSEAMQHLNTCTAALEESLLTEDDTTATTESTATTDSTDSHRLSMPSSGYGTLPNTPACSEGALSTGAVTAAQSGVATIRRSSVQSSMRGPVPPLRRNSSISGGAVPVVPPNVPKLPGHDGQHRRSHSETTGKQRTSSVGESRTTVDKSGDKSDHHPKRSESLQRTDPALRRATFSMSDGDDDDDTDSVDDLPLPPPPMELSNPDNYKVRRQSSNITATHSDVMSTLNQKLGAKRPQSSPALIRAHQQVDQPIYAIPQVPQQPTNQQQPIYTIPQQAVTGQQPIYTLPTTQGASGAPDSQPIYATPYQHPAQQQQQQQAAPQQQYTQLPLHYTTAPKHYTPPAYTHPPQYPANTTSYRRSDSPDSMDDVTPTTEQPPSTFLQQITRGVRLRRTISNDRSAPKLA